MVGLSSLQGAALAWTPHAGSPVPRILFEPVRGGAGELLDFQRVALNAAAEDVVRDWALPSRVSRWPDDGVVGLELEDCVRLDATGVPLSVPLRVRREGVEARFLAVGVKEVEGFALWLLPATVITVVATAFLTTELPTRRALRVAPAAALARP